jgi:hypothetical protein
MVCHNYWADHYQYESNVIPFIRSSDSSLTCSNLAASSFASTFFSSSNCLWNLASFSASSAFFFLCSTVSSACRSFSACALFALYMFNPLGKLLLPDSDIDALLDSDFAFSSFFSAKLRTYFRHTLFVPLLNVAASSAQHPVIIRTTTRASSSTPLFTKSSSSFAHSSYTSFYTSTKSSSSFATL